VGKGINCGKYFRRKEMDFSSTQWKSYISGNINPMTKPTRLFHYTTINNLALVLKSASIRFGRLDKANDMTEGESSDFHSLAPYIFISCWTKNSEENLALWNMYTPKMRGVRIELPLPIFESHAIGKNTNSLYPESKMVDENQSLFIVSGSNEPYEIEYTDDLSRLKPSIIVPDGLKVTEVGKIKRSIWSVENECRYRMDIFPIDKNRNAKDFRSRYEGLIDRQVPPSIDGYLIPINTTSLRSMKIVSGPKIENGDQEIIESLISKYNPSAILESSALKGLIR
jgi:hypothetical protein